MSTKSADQRAPLLTMPAERPKAPPSVARQRDAMISDIKGKRGRPKRVSFEISPRDHQLLKTYAVTRGKSIKDLITDLITPLIDEQARRMPPDQDELPLSR